MRNYCFNRFTLRTDNIEARRKVLRWLALNYRLYEYIPSKNEVRGRFIARKPFPLAAFRHLTERFPTTRHCFYGSCPRICTHSIWRVTFIRTASGMPFGFNTAAPNIRSRSRFSKNL